MTRLPVRLCGVRQQGDRDRDGRFGTENPVAQSNGYSASSLAGLHFLRSESSFGSYDHGTGRGGWGNLGGLTVGAGHEQLDVGLLVRQELCEGHDRMNLRDVCSARLGGCRLRDPLETFLAVIPHGASVREKGMNIGCACFRRHTHRKIRGGVAWQSEPQVQGCCDPGLPCWSQRLQVCDIVPDFMECGEPLLSLAIEEEHVFAACDLYDMQKMMGGGRLQYQNVACQVGHEESSHELRSSSRATHGERVS